MHDNPDYHIGSPDMKRTLKKENNLYKSALENELEELKTEAVKYGKYALIGGGIAAGLFLTYKLLRKEDEDAEPGKKTLIAPASSQVVVEKTVKENAFLSYLKEQLTFIALTILREKVSQLTGIDKKKLIYNNDEPSEKSKEK